MTRLKLILILACAAAVLQQSSGLRGPGQHIFNKFSALANRYKTTTLPPIPIITIPIFTGTVTDPGTFTETLTTTDTDDTTGSTPSTTTSTTAGTTPSTTAATTAGTSPSNTAGTSPSTIAATTAGTSAGTTPTTTAGTTPSPIAATTNGTTAGTTGNTTLTTGSMRSDDRITRDNIITIPQPNSLNIYEGYYDDFNDDEEFNNNFSEVDESYADAGRASGLKATNQSKQQYKWEKEDERRRQQHIKRKRLNAKRRRQQQRYQELLVRRIIKQIIERNINEPVTIVLKPVPLPL